MRLPLPITAPSAAIASPSRPPVSRRNGLGAEIECSGDIGKDPKERYYFRCYLADGAPTRLGYQQAATAYYLGDDLVEQMLASPLPEMRSLYDALADYVAGRTVPDPIRPRVGGRRRRPT